MLVFDLDQIDARVLRDQSRDVAAIEVDGHCPGFSAVFRMRDFSVTTGDFKTSQTLKLLLIVVASLTRIKNLI